jgi:hypothetical protein
VTGLHLAHSWVSGLLYKFDHVAIFDRRPGRKNKTNLVAHGKFSVDAELFDRLELPAGAVTRTMHKPVLAKGWGRPSESHAHGYAWLTRRRHARYYALHPHRWTTWLVDWRLEAAKHGRRRELSEEIVAGPYELLGLHVSRGVVAEHFSKWPSLAEIKSCSGWIVVIHDAGRYN